MINTSNEYKTVIKGARNMYADVSIVFRDGTKLPVDQDGLWGLSIEDNVSGTDSLDVGSAIINQLTLKLDNTDERYNAYNFDGAKITVKIGLQLSKTVEWLNKGVFTADPGEYTGDTITVKAYDNMKKFDRKYSESKLVYPATLGSIVRDACSVCGVSLSTTSFPLDSFVVQTRPTDEALTFREVLTWVGQIACLWCRCNVRGALELGWYDLKGYEDETGHFFEIEDLTSSSISTDDVVITGVKVIKETETDDETVKTEYLSGTEGYILSIEGNDLIQGQNGRTVADSLGEKLIGLRFRKLSVTHKSDPSMEAGDLCKVTDWRGRTYKTLVTGTNFQFGNNQKTECSAETPSRNSTDRFSQQTKNYVKLRKQVAAEKTAREKAIEDLAHVLTNSSGLYITTETQADGSSIYYMHNKPTLKESDIVWKITAEAFGISTDGGKTYPFGFQVTGEMVAKLLAVEGVNASWINSGVLKIADRSGNEILHADVDTGEVRINAKSLSIVGNQVATRGYAESQANEKANAALANGKSYADEKANAALSNGKSYADSVGKAINQEEIFNRLFADGKVQGISLQKVNGQYQLYINASYINAGELVGINIKTSDGNIAIGPNGEFLSKGNGGKCRILGPWIYLKDDSSAKCASGLSVENGLHKTRVEANAYYLNRYNSSTGKWDLVFKVSIGSDEQLYCTIPANFGGATNFWGAFHTYGGTNIHGVSHFYKQIYADEKAYLTGGINSTGAYDNKTTRAANLYIDGSGNFWRVTSSSKRYKEEIEKVKDFDYRQILDAEVYQYRYCKDYVDDHDLKIGFVVEQLQESFPEAVQYENDLPEMWNINTMFPALVKVVQDQQKEIELLKEEVKALRSEIDSLKIS
mgnify:CR=1 FL=1